MTDIQWDTIRPLNGSQNDGFEELCAQLAKIEQPPNGTFTRTGNPDGGVECYWTLPDGTEWAWQAKFFLSSLRTTQWRQLDHSVRTALTNRPDLVRYTICVPQDRSAAKIHNRKSSMQHWEEHVAKWQDWAAEKGMTVDFIWWGSSELIGKLTTIANPGLLRYWFDQHLCSQTWLRERLTEATRAAGRRYSPDIHVSTQPNPTRDLEMFARTETVTNTLKSHSLSIQEAFAYPNFPHVVAHLKKHDIEITDLHNIVDSVVHQLTNLQHVPAGQLSLQEIGDNLRSAIRVTQNMESRLEAIKFQELSNQADHANSTDKHANALFGLRTLTSALQGAASNITRADNYVNSKLMILTGRAGVGKTHTLCDFAARHLDSGTPVILLMGQKFTSDDDPMKQALIQLDYPQDSAFEEFIGVLETAARIANRRALIIVDALNEGRGSTLWEPHLITLIDRIGRSEWIGTILSIRTDFMEETISTEIRSQAAIAVHHGFAGIEFDAIRTFFAYYQLDLPSTPILHPEYSNPLWLKIVCEGLQDSGERHLPRGITGITKSFLLFTQVVNKRLARAENLDYDATTNLVQLALEKLAALMVADCASWLDRSTAKDAVEDILPNRPFSKSLYSGLVNEGLLIESRHSSTTDAIVYFTYERFGDHLKVTHLLNGISDTSLGDVRHQVGELESAFNGRLLTPGVVEALATQIPERVGKELLELVPVEHRLFDIEAFGQSLIWRNPNAVSDTTKDLVSRLVHDQHHQEGVLNALLTIATIEDHALNAYYMDHLLRSYDMPTRDAWWTVNLQGSELDDGPIQRLTAWSFDASRRPIPNTTVELASIVMAWCLTSSDRPVRDTVTKSLVRLLDGRLDATTRLVHRFADIDDLYIAERVYAAAYGVAMRSDDREHVGQLAQFVYTTVFADGTPPVHILLRDYARGIIERAMHLDATLDIELESIYPPHSSTWPDIPDDDAIQHLCNSIQQMHCDNSHATRAWWLIEFSLRGGDFDRYVIGSNSSDQSNDWLNRTLEEAPPQSKDQLRNELLNLLSEEQVRMFAAYEAAIGSPITFDDLQFVTPGEPVDNTPSPRQSLIASTKAEFVATLSNVQRGLWNESNETPQWLDLGIIRRYILHRVVDFGWNGQDFGWFDVTVHHEHNPSREARKPERIGKKYQWLALYEILAYISDRYQYFQRWDQVQRYRGPWQIGLRNLDPSFIHFSDRNQSDSTSWWTPMKYDNWRLDLDTPSWIADFSDIPDLENLLIVKRAAEDCEQWVVASGFQSLKQPILVEGLAPNRERREVWFIVTAYLLPKGKADAFAEWVKSGEYWSNNWSFPSADVNPIFLGEHGWSQSSKQQYEEYRQHAYRWPNSGNENSRTPAYKLATSYSTGFSYDCSFLGSESISLDLPSYSIVDGCKLRWSGFGADYMGIDGRIAAFDPSIHELGSNALLVRSDVIEGYLADQELELCWTVIGEKQTLGTLGQPYGWLQVFGAYVYRNGLPVGTHIHKCNPPSP